MNSFLGNALIKGFKYLLLKTLNFKFSLMKHMRCKKGRINILPFLNYEMVTIFSSTFFLTIA